MPNMGKRPRVIFARVGWMIAYDGPQPGDGQPIGGGSYNNGNIGDEAYNFRVTKGRLYGFFQPSMSSADNINLGRIAPTAAQSSSVDGVLVVFLARNPVRGGSVIVGWYRNAKLWRQRISPSPGKPKKLGHFSEALAADCVLLPTNKREFPIPVQVTGGFGRSNVCYSLEADGSEKAGSWIGSAVDYIAGYEGPNQLVEPDGLIGDAISSGQGFGLKPADRRAVEDHAMKRADRYFRDQGFAIQNVSRSRSYDLECSKKNQVLHVEVKGTTTPGSQVLLTRNEVKQAQDERHACALFILHSIVLKRGKATGGVAVVRWPWEPDDKHLQPITYVYQVA